MPDLLFVYGSLLSRIAHPQGERLRREAALIGPAQLRGRLYRVAWYPGVTPSDDPGDVVHGEIYQLAADGATLGWLDEYEGVTTGASSVAPAEEYARRRCDVMDGAGAVHIAWVYLFQRDTTSLIRVPSGHWLG